MGTFKQSRITVTLDLSAFNVTSVNREVSISIKGDGVNVASKL